MMENQVFKVLEKIFFYTFPIWVFKIGGLKIFEIPLTIIVSLLLLLIFYKKQYRFKKNSLSYILLLLFLLSDFFYGIWILQSFPIIDWAQGVKSYYIWNSLYFMQCLVIITMLYYLNMHGTSINKKDVTIMFFINIILFFIVDIRPYSVFFMEKGLFGGYLAVLSILYFELSVKKSKYFFLIIAILFCINIGSTRGLLFLIGYFIAIYGVKYFSVKNIIILSISSLILIYFLVENNIANVGTKLNLVSDILFDTHFTLYSDVVEKHSVGRYASLFMIGRGIDYNQLFGIGFGNYIFFREIYSNLLPVGFYDYAGFLFADNIVELGIVGTIIWYFLFFKLITYGYDRRIKIQIIVFSIFLTLLAVKNDYYSFMMLAIFLGIQTNKHKLNKESIEKNINN